MGQRVQFSSNDQQCTGYLSAPADVSGPALVVVQEWWGLVPHIEEVADRFSAEGFLSIAPDLYHGQQAASPDEAERLLMELDAETAADELSAAGRYLLSHPECDSTHFSIVGFCMGGALGQYVSTRDSLVSATVSFYGGFRRLKIQWERLEAPILLFYGQEDRGVPAAEGRELGRRLSEMGKRAEIVIYPGAGHGFFNDSRPKSYDRNAASDAWRRTLDFLRRYLQ